MAYDKGSGKSGGAKSVVKKNKKRKGYKSARTTAGVDAPF